MVLCTLLYWNFFLYKLDNIDANGSKCKTKSSVGENDPYKVFQETYFSPQKAENVDYVSFVPFIRKSFQESLFRDNVA